VSFLARWLGWPKSVARTGLRPHRNLELDASYEVVYDRVLAAIDETLGASVAIDDRGAGLIEAAFGLVNNERVRCHLERLGSARTAVRIEAFFPARTAPPERSRAVDALADAIEPRVGL
jgi:hypothetical protein